MWQDLHAEQHCELSTICWKSAWCDQKCLKLQKVLCTKNNKKDNKRNPKSISRTSHWSTINSAEVSLGRYKVWNVAWLKIKWWKHTFFKETIVTIIYIYIFLKILPRSQANLKTFQDMGGGPWCLLIFMDFSYRTLPTQKVRTLGTLRLYGSCIALALRKSWECGMDQSNWFYERLGVLRVASLLCLGNFRKDESLQTLKMRKRLWMGTNVSCVGLVVLCDQSWATESCLDQKSWCIETAERPALFAWKRRLQDGLKNPVRLGYYI